MRCRILHISDYHSLGKEDHARHELASAFLDDLAVIHSQAPIDAVVFTGDLSQSGKLEELAYAETTFLAPLLACLDLDRSRIVLLPGNHDVDRTLINMYLDQGLRATLVSPEAVFELNNRPSDMTSAVERLAGWEQFHTGFYKGCAPEALSPLGFLHRIDLDGVSLAIAALNTAWRCSGDDDQSFLVLGSAQVRTAVESLSQVDLPIVAFHHPLDWLARWDSDDARLQLERARLVVMTGHEHRPDPTTEQSVRGAALYSRGGCLYGSTEWHNGFSVIELSPDDRKATVTLRSWWKQRKEFDAATNLVSGGLREFDWPPAGAQVDRLDLAYSRVNGRLTDLINEHSLVAPHLTGKASDDAQVTDLLVAPRLWKMPYQEAVASTILEDGPKPEPLDSGMVGVGGKTIVVVGERESGVTGTLLWLLNIRFQVHATHVPVYLPFDRRFKASRLDRRIEEQLVGLLDGPRDFSVLPPLSLAIDDVAGDQKHAVSALAEYIAANPQHMFVLGVHGGDHALIHDALSSRDVEVEVVHLGPFGRGELRALVKQLAADQGTTLVERVLGVVFQERLPRTPFTILALVAVLIREAAPAEVNESSVLDAYVSLMLGLGEVGDDDGLGMDQKRREYLLERLAVCMDERAQQHLPRLDAEILVADVLRGLGWGEGLSPGRILESLMGRRVLVEQGGQVCFRHEALRELFLAKWLNESEDFRKKALGLPLRYHGPIRHAAGLRRSNKELLLSVSRVVASQMEDIAGDISVGMFSLLADKPGWVQEEPDLDSLRKRLAVSPPREPDEETLDGAIDDLHDRAEFVAPEEGVVDAIDQMEQLTELLTDVLRNSELVDNLDAKTDILKDVLRYWCLTAIGRAVKENESEEVATRLGGDDGAVDGEDTAATRFPDADKLERFIELLIVVMVILQVQGGLGTRHLQGVTRRVLNDTEFIEEPAQALLATMLYCVTDADDWPQEVVTLYRQHRQHPIVAQLVIHFLLSAYRSRSLRKDHERVIEAFLAEVFAGVFENGAASGLELTKRRSSALKQLRRERTAIAMSVSGQEAILLGGRDEANLLDPE